MSYSAYQSGNTKVTPQSEPIPGETQVQNNAGGFVYELDRWKYLSRFLILGTEGGTYYVKERKLTADAAKCVTACLDEDGLRTVNTIVGISHRGSAVKNDAAIFALAMAASTKKDDKQGNAAKAIRKYALMALPEVCRIPTHLFHFMASIHGMRGWSRMLRTAIGNWYKRWDRDQLAFELVKYQQRDGWSHRDVFRLAHVKVPEPMQAVVRWSIGATFDERHLEDSKRNFQRNYPAVGEFPPIIAAFEEAKVAPLERVVQLIHEYNLTREMVPTAMLNHPEIWAALLEKMPVHALLRNLGNMSKVGLLTPLSETARLVTVRLTNPKNVVVFRERRVHPVSILIALKTYGSGKGVKGSGTWTPVPQVVDALDAALYMAFDAVEPSAKRVLYGVDVSGSMGSPCGSLPITCAEGAAVMALACAKAHPQHYIMGFAHEFRDLGITPRMRLTEALAQTRRHNFGATDCSLPALWARDARAVVDQIVVITDNETWSGRIHPRQALQAYRNATGIPVKQVVIGMTATQFSIADPTDPLSLDVVGFDTSVPQAVSEFASA